ncbi:hypothetical protein [Macrococcus armenti]|uniref:hypothetical protein n=1 Tax=Macrococcus armenti TaxID=2875764 RepID=UPI001CCDE3D4|nr:hypothetical protein [Macrococcus armenti]UBH07649.1 hypothetical protein LAU41_06305 [Macrococcus armenti]UBH09882.1 hypothetical protein LAU38_06205 [Macrococcus armenti]UBH14432.1 hypothetical protein LAU44_06490 [Macrococcus armenti]UBH16792.1 hypothetical protein LAU39_06505 [Macrococcus armenti]UBH19055.1 hypothetical protein LAU40_06495 [Macrococcus armenti]
MSKVRSIKRNQKPAQKKMVSHEQEQKQGQVEKPRNNMMLLTFITMMALVWGLMYWFFIV